MQRPQLMGPRRCRTAQGLGEQSRVTAPWGVGDPVCPSRSSGESSSACVGAGCSVRGEVWVWVVFKRSPTLPQSSCSCRLCVSWFSLVPHQTSWSPSPGWGSQRVGTGWSRLRAEWGNSVGSGETRVSFLLALPLVRRGRSQQGEGKKRGQSC